MVFGGLVKANGIMKAGKYCQIIIPIKYLLKSFWLDTVQVFSTTVISNTRWNIIGHYKGVWGHVIKGIQHPESLVMSFNKCRDGFLKTA